VLIPQRRRSVVRSGLSIAPDEDLVPGRLAS